MPDTKVFDGWDGQLPDSPAWLLSHATFFMPDRDLTVNARWLKAPLWAWEPVPGLEGVAVVHQPQLPEGLEGRPPILVLLHDAGQDLRFWQLSSEARLFARAAAARGVGLLAVQSSDSARGRWDLIHRDIAGDPDLSRLLTAVHAAGFVGPLVFVGVGDGAAFADLATHAFMPLSSVQASAAILVGSAGSATDWGDGQARLWVFADKDNAAAKAEALSIARLQIQRVPTGLVELTPWPMFPRRFWRVDGLTAGESIQFHKSLMAAGVLDQRGRVLRDPATLDAALLPEDLRPAAPNLLEQLNAGWSGHGLAHAMERMLDFAWDFGQVGREFLHPRARAWLTPAM